MKVFWMDIWKIPNLLSLYRLILGFIFPLFWIKKIHPWILIFLICSAAISDFLDGRIARKFNQETSLGKILDPLADKFFINTLFFLLYLSDFIPFYFLLIILGRDVGILFGAIILYLKYHGKIEFKPTKLGKISTAFQLIFLIFYYAHIFFISFNPVMLEVTFYLVIFFTLVSGLSYMILFWKFFKGSATK